MFFNVDMIVGNSDKNALKKAFLSDINLRWGVTAVSLVLGLVYIKFNPGRAVSPLFIILGLVAAINGFYLYIAGKKEEHTELLLGVSGFVDIAFITAAVYYTGGMASPLFLIYYFVLLDRCFDYWSNRYFFFYMVFILAAYTGVYLIGAKGVFITPDLALLLMRMFFLVGVGLLGYSVAREMRKQYLNSKRVGVEKEILYDKLKEANFGLEQKIKKSTENLEKTNLMLVKKNISLLAAHEIYKTANESNSREELLDMVLGIIFPLMKGNGGVIFSLNEEKNMMKIESFKKILGSYTLEKGKEYELEQGSEFREMMIKKKARLFDNIEGARDKFIKDVIKEGSCIAAPLISRGEATGFVFIFNKSPYVYNKTDSELIELLGEQIGTLLFNRDIYEEMKVKAAGLEKLMKLTIEVESSLEIEEIVDSALSESIKKIFINSCGVVIMLDDSNELKIKAQHGHEKKILDKTISPSGIAGWVCKNNRSLLIRDVSKIKFYNPDTDKFYLKGPSLIVPISIEGKVAGAMCLSRRKQNYTREDLYFLTILANYVGGAIHTARLYANIKRDYTNTIYSLAAAVDAKDHYTHGHSATVMKYSTRLAEELQLSGEEIDTIKYAGLLHDIGKIGISETIINKPGKLSNEEYAIIKMHPQLGANIISKIDSLKKLVPLVLSHHEWMNGTGYPLGLRGEEIPLGARIISAADAYSTMTSKRPYRDERSMEFAIGELKKCSGTQFDPKIVSVFLKILKEEIKEIRKEKEKESVQYSDESGHPAAKKKRFRVKLEGDPSSPKIVHDEDDIYS